MDQRHTRAIAGELGIESRQVTAVIELIDDGATIPFIARYRKEATGSLDETIVTSIRERAQQLQALDKRRQAILDSLRELKALSPELEAKLRVAETLSVLEDLYLPYRPKRRTKAAIAREKGLEPLARTVFEQAKVTDPTQEAQAYVDPERSVADCEQALSGARDIISEWVSEDAAARSQLRTLFSSQAVIRSRAVSEKAEDDSRYRDYHKWEEIAEKAPSHRVLAIFRGEAEGFLRVQVRPDDEAGQHILERLFVRSGNAASEQVQEAVKDGYKRLLRPSLESEFRQALKTKADREAIRIFAENLRHLLLAPPLGPKNILALDPGFRTGCKLVCLDRQGNLVHWETIYPHSGEHKVQEAGARIVELCRAHAVEAIAVGNGTAGRETLAFIKALQLPKHITPIMVDERGASIYSASAVAREEFPALDLTVRGAISIGRRLLDPLAELVKIEPQSIGVGQYQHDVDQKLLKAALDDVVVSCVNAVGVNVNTASSQLLAYVSGLGPGLAKNIVSHREQHGPFQDRRQFTKIPRLGPKAFQQAAAFLRIADAPNPLDRSAVHPESYPVVKAMAEDLGCHLPDLIGDPSLRAKLNLSRYVTERIGLPTLNDILEELAKPGRDPRASFESVSFTTGVESVEDLRPGMVLAGIVTNVTAFGAFVDVGVHRDGLVHVSELSDRFVADPGQVVHVNQRVQVTVLDVDLKRHRISLSMKANRPGPTPEGSTARPSKQSGATASPDRKNPSRKDGRKRVKGAFNTPFERLLKDPSSS